jgi:predicted dehydrogenase
MPYSIVQVGLGDFGRRWLNIVNKHPSWEYAAIATRNDDVRRQCGELCNLPTERRFLSLRDSLEAGVTADVVLVTTPHFRHQDDVILALENGMDVLVEKPLAGSWDECLAIRDAAARSDHRVMVAENYRFCDGAIMMRDIVASGEIGTLEFLNMEYFVGHTFPDGDWRNEYEYPMLVENATHQFDLVRFVTGNDAEEVFCTARESARTPHWPFPSVSAQFAMNRGFRFAFSGSWAYREFRTPWEGRWRLYGSSGAIIWDMDTITVESEGKTRTLPVPSKDSDHTLSATFDELTASMDDGRAATTSIEDNMQTVAMVYASIESNRRNLPVTISEMLTM